MKRKDEPRKSPICMWCLKPLVVEKDWPRYRVTHEDGSPQCVRGQ